MFPVLNQRWSDAMKGEHLDRAQCNTPVPPFQKGGLAVSS